MMKKVYMLNIIVCGDRKWKDYDAILLTMSQLKSSLGSFLVIEGEAQGADTFARHAAKYLDLQWQEYPANWALYNRAAGPIRNTQMLREGKADAVIAFHNNLQGSKGTKNMVEQAIKAGLPVWVCTQGEEALLSFILQLRKRSFDGWFKNGGK